MLFKDAKLITPVRQNFTAKPRAMGLSLTHKLASLLLDCLLLDSPLIDRQLVVSKFGKAEIGEINAGFKWNIATALLLSMHLFLSLDSHTTNAAFTQIWF